MAFYDNSIFSTQDNGELDLLTNSIAVASYRTGVFVAGNTQLFEYRAFEADAPNIGSGATVQNVVGLHVPAISSGTNRIGIRNDSERWLESARLGLLPSDVVDIDLRATTSESRSQSLDRELAEAHMAYTVLDV